MAAKKSGKAAAKKSAAKRAPRKRAQASSADQATAPDTAAPAQVVDVVTHAREQADGKRSVSDA